MMDNCQDRVLISGAGPVGLTAALALLNKDIPVTLIDSYKDVPTDPRASTFHPPTMELLEKINVTKEMLEKGLIVNKWQCPPFRMFVFTYFSCSCGNLYCRKKSFRKLVLLVCY